MLIESLIRFFEIFFIFATNIISNKSAHIENIYLSIYKNIKNIEFDIKFQQNLYIILHITNIMCTRGEKISRYGTDWCLPHSSVILRAERNQREYIYILGDF